jgi:hypothetical protein
MLPDEIMPGLLLGGVSLLVGGSMVFESCHRQAFLRRLLQRLLLWRFVVYLFLVLWMLPYYAESGADAIFYHIRGLEVASAIRAGAWNDIVWGLGSPAFTILTGVLYLPFGGSLNALYFLSMFVGLGAAISLYKAFALFGSPRQSRVYGLLVFFLPSYSMWTSIHGKDSWVGLGLGLSAYGYGLWLRGNTSKGVLRLGLGMLLVTVFRPYVACLIAAALLASQVVCHGRGAATSWAQKALRLAVLLPLFLFVALLAKDFVGLGELTANAALAQNDLQVRGNAQGGSAIEYETAYSVTDLIKGFPAAIVKVLFRPFLWEAHNLNAVLAAIENVFLLFFTLRRVGSLKARIGQVARQPYLMFSITLAFLLLFVYSGTPNLGLLSRMRAQLLPFVFVALVGMETNTSRGRPRRMNLAARRRFVVEPPILVGKSPAAVC